MLRKREIKIKLIQLWLGKIPDYFWFHYETTKNLENVDFVIFTDSELDLNSENYEVLRITKEEIERRVSSMLGTEYRLSSSKKANDLKSCLGELFEDHLEGYDYYGFYDIDTLFGDFQKWIFPHLPEYDVISFADEKFHDRLAGPLTIIRNTFDYRRIYRKNLDRFIEKINTPDIGAFEEQELTNIAFTSGKVKLIYNSVNCETLNGGKNTYSSYWIGGKVFSPKEEKLLYHFYHKKKTKLQKIGNSIFAQYDKKYLDDFLWVVHFSEKYETLLPYLMDSLKKFSNRKCVLYSVNYTPEFFFRSQMESDQFIFRRIDIEPGIMDNRGRDSRIMNSKPLILMDAIQSFPGKKFVHIDTDTYLTPNSDDIVKYFGRLENYPLMNSHIHDVMYISGINPSEEWSSPLHILLEAMEEKNHPIFPRRKCNVILFDERSFWFFEEQMNLYERFKDSKIPGILAMQDEDTANSLLAKYQLPNSLPLVDIEESYDLDINKIYNYSYNMTGTSPFAELPKEINDFLFFHGFKNPLDYELILEKYGSKTLENEEMVLEYLNNTLWFTKNSFLTNKFLENEVDFLIYDSSGNEIFRLGNQQIYNYSIFYVSDFFLPEGIYQIKIHETLSRRCVFKDIISI